MARLISQTSNGTKSLRGNDAAFLPAASFSIYPKWEQLGGSCPGPLSGRGYERVFTV
jgi:hypothetical protein